MKSGKLHYQCFGLLIVVALMAACSRDPQIRKKEYFDKGSSYFEKGKYEEAIIEYRNAIQIDPNFADAHYELARSLMKKGDWTHGFQELTRTIQLAPSNLKAQLDLAEMYLASHRFQEAHDHADLVLKSDPHNAQAEVVLSNSDAALGESQIPVLSESGIYV